MQKVKRIIKRIYIKTKFYNKKRSSEVYSEALIFFIKDGYGQKHPGLVDRFKAIVGLYYIAKKNSLPYKIKYNYLFELEEYLLPNQVDWICNDAMVSFANKDVRVIDYRADMPIPKLGRSNTQYHCYYYEGLNILKQQNINEWEKEWSNLFEELFIPSPKLNKLLELFVPKKRYIAVHIRFLNSLDNFEEGYTTILTPHQKKSLICKCLVSLNIIKTNNLCSILVFSDSISFLKIAVENGYEVLPFSDIGHISYHSGEKIIDKTFVDFYAISMAEKVYSLRGTNLYNSAFPQYAAIIGKKEYVIVNI